MGLFVEPTSMLWKIAVFRDFANYVNIFILGAGSDSFLHLCPRGIHHVQGPVAQAVVSILWQDTL